MLQDLAQVYFAGIVGGAGNEAAAAVAVGLEHGVLAQRAPNCVLVLPLRSVRLLVVLERLAVH